LVRIHTRRATRPKVPRKPQSSRSRAANTGLVPAVLGGNEPPPEIALTSASGPKPAVLATESHFRFAPQSRHLERTLDSSVWADFVEKGSCCDAEISVIQSV
jgi:hypothetical protein